MNVFTSIQPDPSAINGRPAAGPKDHYRRDIDGLRAIAVMAVILCHAGLPPFSGGFIGVDVFFVISGFLITSILRRELTGGRFSIAHFYERRARRILPALLLVIVVTTPFAWVLMFPHFFQNFAQSVVATLLFANNVLLVMTGGYWDLESSLKPMLHTWSLGVEEQFYVVFPLLLLALWRLGARWQLTVIIALGVASLVAAEVGQVRSPSTNFFLSTSRAWELMIGCAVAYATLRPRPWNNALSFAGLVAIVIPIFTFTEHTPSPSFWILIPVLGTAAVLLASREGTVAFRLLSLRACVGVGLISYSAYLWHQPLFALTRVALTETPSALLMLGLAGLSLGLAYLSWRFVEVPIRDAKKVPLRLFLAGIIPAYALVLAGAGLVYVNKGFPQYTFPNAGGEAQSYAQYNERVWTYRAASFPENGRPNVLVLGNSVGRDAANVLIEAGILDGSNLVYQPVIPEYLCQQLPSIQALAAKANFIVAAIAPGGSDVEGITKGVECARAASRAEVVILGPKHFGANINPFARVPMADRKGALSALRPGDVAYNATFKVLFGGKGYVDLIALLGPDGKSVSIFDTDGNPLTADRLHLTKYGAAFLAKRLVDANPDRARRLGLRR